MPNIVPATPQQLAAAAPNWERMRTAIAECERVDEVRHIADQAQAIQVYYAQSRDVDNEVKAMRVRTRAERRMGELLDAEQRAGRMGTQESGRPPNVSSLTTLTDLGISRDRAARAQDLARVPERQFEAALASHGRPTPTAVRNATRAPEPPRVDVSKVLMTWGRIRDFKSYIDNGELLDPAGWTRHAGIQPFQVQEIRAAVPAIVDYLSRLMIED